MERRDGLDRSALLAQSKIPYPKSLRMLIVLHRLVQVFLKFTHLVGNEAKRVMKREPLDVLRVFLQIAAQAVQFRKHLFGFDRHGVTISNSRDATRRNTPTHWPNLPMRHIITAHGAVAQLGERLNRIQEVESSSLFCSTFVRNNRKAEA